MALAFNSVQLHIRYLSNMVKITTHTPVKTVANVQPTKNVGPVEPSAADKSVGDENSNFVDRRKNNDRRRDARGRGPYEMRSGTDRRRNNRGKPSIDTDV